MLHGKLLLYLGGACSCYLDMLNEAQEQLCRTDDPTLSLELPLAHIEIQRTKVFFIGIILVI